MSSNTIELLKLSNIISNCLNNNLLWAKPNVKAKGKEWLVLYINRMLCVQFDLPLQYGGWREHSLDKLMNWMDFGFQINESD